MADNIDITFDFDMSKLKKGFDFTKFPKAVERGLKNGRETLVLKMEQKLMDKLIEYGLGDSSFVGDIKITDNKYGILMEIDSEYALYVEYGTGIVGSESPHPNPISAYDINNHGEKGWIYPKNGGFYWTKGQPAKPFMYETWLWTKSQATKIIRQKVNQELKRAIGGR